MNLPLHVVNGRFAARCSLHGSPDQSLLGVIDSGSTATCVDAQVCSRADLEFAGEGDSVQCVHRGHREIVRSYFGHIDICGRTVYTRVYELDMGPEREMAGVNAILGWDVLDDFKITLDKPSGTGSIELRTGA